MLSELRAELEYAESLREYYRDALAAGVSAYAGLTDRGDIDDETILINAFRISQYNWYERRRAVFDEMVSSGVLYLISDETLRETAIMYYNTPLFAMVRTEGQNSRFRELFRMLIDPAVHTSIREKCGDLEYDSVAGAAGLLTIGYECSLAIDDESLSRAITLLRNDPGRLPALRLRNAQIDGCIYDLELTLKNTGLATLFGERRR